MRAGLRFLLAMVLAAFAFAARADVRHGLDQRPVNDTCVAPPLPPRSADTTVAPAFGGLVFDNTVSMQQASQQAAGLPPRWFVAERGGRIKTLLEADTAASVALDITGHMAFTNMADVSDSQQAGITAIALHPDFEQNGYLYIAYNRKPSATAPVVSYLSRFTANADRAQFDANSETVLLSLEQSTPWHHVGQAIFGPDGYLYVGLGDGARVVPDARTFRAQDPRSLFGKILRIDVDGGMPYGIPPTNPFADGVNGLPEVWAMGFRNPWRFTFDRQTGEMWASDVGQSTLEEVDRVDAGGNYGWPWYEGTLCRQASCAGVTGLVPPVYTFGRTDGPAITGGYVYRGSDILSLRGTYVFGSVAVTSLWGLLLQEGFQRIDLAQLPQGISPSSFMEDLRGELYVIHAQQPSPIYRLAASAGGPPVAPPVPPLLSATGCVDPLDPRQMASGVIPYDVNMSLWSDNAAKTRGMALPDGGTITVKPDGDLDFPDGTVFVKIFLFDNRPIETRLFMRHAGGNWQGYTYEWRDDLSDADLLPDGKVRTIRRTSGANQRWVYPSRNECLVCHSLAAGSVLGPEIAQLNGDMRYPQTGRTSNQLATWAHVGLFGSPLAPAHELPALAKRTGTGVSPVRRARAYLHANCAFCHRPGGNAQANLDLRASRTMLQTETCNKPALTSNLGVEGAQILTPGDPSLSLLWLRMDRRDANGMPPLASLRVDHSMVRQIGDWIGRADVCEDAPDSDADGVPDSVDNCTLTFNPDQGDDNRDGFGNRCDGDINNDLVTDAADRSSISFRVRQAAIKNLPAYRAYLDLNRDQIVDATDLAIFDAELAGRPPGPSALRP